MSLNPIQNSLAIKQLFHRPKRAAAAITGIAFSNILVLFQWGLLNALYKSQSEPYRHLNGDLVILSSSYTNKSNAEFITKQAAQRAFANKNIESVSFLNFSVVDVLNPYSKIKRQALLYAIDPDSPAFNPSSIALNTQDIQPFGKVVFNQESVPEFAKPLIEELNKRKTLNLEINQKSTQVNGFFSINITFNSNISLLTSRTTYKQIANENNPNTIQLAVLKLTDPTLIEKTKHDIQTIYSNNPLIQVLSIKELQRLETIYWKNNTAFGFIFGMGMIVGLAVSAIILYQILYSDVSEHCPEYATLKAIGYPNSFIVSIIIQEAGLMISIAFLPSIAISVWIYQALAVQTKLLFDLTLFQIVTMFFSSWLISTSSGWIAADKVRRLDPADSF